LLKIEGGGILVAIMKATPIFHSFIELFDSTEKFDVSICKTSNNQAKLKGNKIQIDVIDYEKDRNVII
jgi:hypothetical protein